METMLEISVFAQFKQSLRTMKQLAKHQIEQAKEQLRTVLSFEYITAIPKFKNYTVEQYENLVSNIELLSLVLIESFIQTNSIHHG